MKQILFLFTLFLFWSCDTKRYPIDMPNDFAIKIDFGHQKYNSRTGILTREFMRSPDKHIRINLTVEQKIEIYKYYKKVDFLSFPSEFECDTLKPGGVIPSYDFEIEITSNKIVKSSRTSDYCLNKIEKEKEKNLIVFEHMILKIIENDVKYKKMPDTDYINL